MEEPAGPLQYVVAKASQDLVPQWISALGDHASGTVAFSPSSVDAIVAGLLSGDITFNRQVVVDNSGDRATRTYVASMDASGQLLWVRELSSGGIPISGVREPVLVLQDRELFGPVSEGSFLFNASFRDSVQVDGLGEIPSGGGDDVLAGRIRDDTWTGFDHTVIGACEAYPNPARGSVTITGIESGTHLRIIDMLGRVVLSHSVAASSESGISVDLDLRGLPAGAYWISGAGECGGFVRVARD